MASVDNHADAVDRLLIVIVISNISNVVFTILFFQVSPMIFTTFRNLYPLLTTTRKVREHPKICAYF